MNSVQNSTTSVQVQESCCQTVWNAVSDFFYKIWEAVKNFFCCCCRSEGTAASQPTTGFNAFRKLPQVDVTYSQMWTRANQIERLAIVFRERGYTQPNVVAAHLFDEIVRVYNAANPTIDFYDRSRMHQVGVKIQPTQVEVLVSGHWDMDQWRPATENGIAYSVRRWTPPADGSPTAPLAPLPMNSLSRGEGVFIFDPNDRGGLGKVLRSLPICSEMPTAIVRARVGRVLYSYAVDTCRHYASQGQAVAFGYQIHSDRNPPKISVHVETASDGARVEERDLPLNTDIDLPTSHV